MNFRRSVTVVALNALWACFLSNIALLATIYRTWIPAIPLVYGLILVFYILTRRLSFPSSLYPALVAWNRARTRSAGLAMLTAIAFQGYLAYYYREYNSWSWIPTPDYSFSLLFFIKANLIVTGVGALIGIRDAADARHELEEAERRRATDSPVSSANPASVSLI